METFLELLKEYGMEIQQPFNMYQKHKKESKLLEFIPTKELLHMLAVPLLYGYRVNIKDIEKMKKSVQLPEKYKRLPDACFKSTNVIFDLIEKEKETENKMQMKFERNRHLYVIGLNIKEDVLQNPKAYGLTEKVIAMTEIFENGRLINQKKEKIITLYEDFLGNESINSTPEFRQKLERILESEKEEFIGAASSRATIDLQKNKKDDGNGSVQSIVN